MKCSRLFVVLFICSTMFSVTACRDFSNKVLGKGELKDTLTEKLVVKEKIPHLLNRWDSLQKNQIQFTVDSLHPVPIKQQKRELKDSLRKAFDTYPKHIYLTFDDGPLIGSAFIDSIAKEKNIKVSVFLIGKHANMSKGRKRDLARYESNPLIACYNHS